MAATLLICCAAPAEAGQGIAQDILALTNGARVKVVWAQDERGDAPTWDADTDGFELWGYDTDTDNVAPIREQWRSYNKPTLTHDGNRVVYSDSVTHEVRVVGWDGLNDTVVISGRAGGLWYDPHAGIEWVYFQTPADETKPIRRLDLDHPTNSQLVWNQTAASSGYLMVSGDGARVVGCWPWPKCGVIAPLYDGSGGGDIYYSDNGYYATGCLPTITPDDTYRVGVFDGTHRMWKVWDSPGGAQRLVQLHTAVPTMSASDCVYHPRHGTHPRFITLTAPMLDAQDPIEVHLGMTDAGFTEVTDWIQVTTSDVQEMWPHVWVSPSSVQIDAFTVTPTTIVAGNSAELSWATGNATAASLSPGIGDVATTGSRTVSPLQTTVYTLTVQGPGGPVTRQVTLNVILPGLERIALTPAAGVLLTGQASTISARAFDNAGGAMPVVFEWSVSGGGTVQPAASGAALEEHTVTFVSDGTVGSFEVTVRAATVSATMTVMVRAPEPVHLRINAGDGTPAVAGWEDEDPYRVGGVSFDFPGPVAPNNQLDPAPLDVYLTCIHGDHDYNFPVPNGPYRLRLHFFDHLDDGGRAMVISAEGEILLDGFDVPVVAGGTFRALVQEFDVTVGGSDGLHIEDRMGTGGDVFESGLEVISLDGGPPTVEISEPAVGEVISGNGSVSGTASDDVALHRVEIGIDDGAFVAAVGTDAWSLELMGRDLPDGEHLLKARAVDWVGNVTTVERSFSTSNQPRITILRPTGGETWHAGSVETIEWETINLDHVAIELSLDGGETFESQKIVETLRAGAPGWGKLAWTVPATPTDRAVILIQGYFREVPVFSPVFAIAPPEKTTNPSGWAGTSCNSSPRRAGDSMLAALCLLALGIPWSRRRGKRGHHMADSISRR